jgi:hypothetical protein
VYFLAGLALLPACGIATHVTFEALRMAQGSASQWVPPAGLAVGAGYLAWLAAFYLLPRPVRVYVLAHELTHALWGRLFGARVGRIRVGRRDGSVTLSKVNALITLAPYFFPLYAVIVIVTYYTLALFVPVAPYRLWWLALVGFTWGFHLTFTVTSLSERQSDIEAHGRLFSYTLIYLLNALGIALWVALVSDATLAGLARVAVADGRWLAAWVRGLAATFGS